MATPNIVPRADSEGQLGTASKYWAAAYIDLIYVGAGKIGRDSDNLIDFSSDNQITFRLGNGNELTIDTTQIYPATNDGLALGYATLGFSDLFLASGAVINFDNGNLTLTHTSNTLTLADGDVFALGTSRDLQLFHESENSYISNNIGDLTIRNLADDKDIIFQSDDGTGGVETYFFLDGSANGTSPLTVFPDNSNLAFGSGPDTYLMHNGTDFLLDNHNSGDIILRNNVDDKDIVFQCDDGSGGVTTYFFLDGDNVMTQVHKNFRIMDSVQLQLGTSGDLSLSHNATDSQITNATGNLQFTNTADDKDISFASDNGNGGDAIYFYLDGSSATYSGGATTALYTNWPDKSIISLGTSHDLKIYHDGSSTYMENGEGNFNIMQRADGADLIFSCDDGSTGDTAYLTLDGGAEKIYMYKSTVFTGGGMDYGVDGTGADVIFYGDTAGRDMKWDQSEDHLLFKDSTKLKLGTGGDLEIYHDGSNSYIDDTGTGLLYIRGDAGINITAPTGGEVYAKFIKDGACEFRHNDGTRLVTTATGISVTGATGTAVGGGFDGAEACDISVGEINSEIVTTIYVDLGQGGATNIASIATADAVIGEGTTAAAYLTRITTAVNGVVYRGDFVCIEAPDGGDDDINLASNSASLAAQADVTDGSGHLLSDGGTQGLATSARLAIPNGGIQDDYLYLAAGGGDAAGDYTVGKFMIRLYGFKTTGL